MDDFLRRRELITGTRKKEESNIIYHAENLVLNGSNYVNTGFKPFSQEEFTKASNTENLGFEIEFQIQSPITVTSQTAANFMFLACRVENGSTYPGFYVKANNSKGSSPTQMQIGKYDYVSIPINTVIDHPLIIRKELLGTSEGNWKAEDYLGRTYTLDIHNNSSFNQFDQPLIIGATIDPNGNASRFGSFTLKYITIRYIPVR